MLKGFVFFCLLVLLQVHGTAAQALDMEGGDSLQEALQAPAADPQGSEVFYGGRHALRTRSEVPLPRPVVSTHSWVAWILLACLFLLGTVRQLYPGKLGQFLRASFDIRQFSQIEREGQFFDEIPVYLLFLNYLVVMALLLWQTLWFIAPDPARIPLHPALLLPVLLLLITVFYILKSSLVGFLAWVFGTRQASEAYLKNLFLYNLLMGVVLLPLLAYNAYSPSLQVTYAAWGLWLLGNAVKLTRGAVIGQQVAGFSAYYLILYLCAIEIAPLAILIKVASNYLTRG